jgi:hypothetical protein
MKESVVEVEDVEVAVPRFSCLVGAACNCRLYQLVQLYHLNRAT